MKGLTAQDLVVIAELGERCHEVDRALIVLSRALPELSIEQLAEMPVGERDAQLLRVREQLFGTDLWLETFCPHCGEGQEIRTSTREQLFHDFSKPLPRRHRLESGEITVEFRLLDSRDLSVATRTRELGAARRCLVRRSIVAASRGGVPIAPEDLPENVLTELADALTEADPQAEIKLGFRCLACEKLWIALFDIVPVLWRELREQVRHLLHDIHDLASAYGWRESDILALSDSRRRFYLSRIGA